MKITPFYDRQYLVDSTLHTVAHSVSLGITLVVLVLLLFLGRPSIAALVAMTIPFSLLVALALMYLTDIPIGLLSIGAIDFGIIVDGAVIVAENIARRLGEATRRDGRPNVFQVVLAASLEVERPVFFSMLMVMVAYVPLLSLTSIEGLLFRPMALTMVFALVGALLFAIFVVPGPGDDHVPPGLPRSREPAVGPGPLRVCGDAARTDRVPLAGGRGCVVHLGRRGDAGGAASGARIPAVHG